MQMKVCVCACVFVCVRVSSFTTMCMDVHARMLVGHLCQCLKALCVCICKRVCARARICAAHSWRILFKKLSRLLLCLPCHYNYKGHLTLNPHSLSPPSNIWPVFLLWLNDWMHPHRFLLTSSPIWNLVPVRSAEDAHTCAHVQTQDTHTHTHI